MNVCHPVLPSSSPTAIRCDGAGRSKLTAPYSQVLEWAFGKRITPAERLRKNQRLLDKAIRELDQQRVKLEKQEKTLIAQIRQSAQKGQMGACKVQAKDLVRTRRCVAHLSPADDPAGC
jgi:hypothetical protein